MSKTLGSQVSDTCSKALLRNVSCYVTFTVTIFQSDKELCQMLVIKFYLLRFDNRQYYRNISFDGLFFVNDFMKKI